MRIKRGFTKLKSVFLIITTLLYFFKSGGEILFWDLSQLIQFQDELCLKRSISFRVN